MAELYFSPELENHIRAAMSVPDPAPEFTQALRSRLIAKQFESSPRATGIFSRPALRWGLAALAVTLIIILAVGPQRVVSAFQQLLGYLPGFGIVEQNPDIRVLAEPVTQKREGVTVTVEEAFLDAARTLLVFQYDGIPMISAPEGDSQTLEICSEKTVLRFPDGRELVAGLGWGTGWGTGYEHHFEFPPLPMDIDEAVFVIPCLPGTISGSAPENWELPLRFIPAPPDMTIYPVIEIPTPTPTARSSVTPMETPDTNPTLPEVTQDQPGAGSPPPTAENQIQLTLDRAVQMEDSYILYATFSWESDLYTFISPGMARLEDAAGNLIPFEYAEPELSTIFDPHQQPMAVKALGPLPSGPITLSIDNVYAELPTDTRFTFDTGPDLQPGQVWELNQTVEIEGHTLTILTASAIDAHGHPGFEFKIKTGPGVESARLIDPERPPMGGGGGGGGGGGLAETVRTSQLLYDGELPEGRITISVQGLSLNLPGPWQASWTPTGDQQPGSADQREGATCLTDEAWTLARKQAQTLPDIWAGKLAHFGPVAESEDWHISVLDLDAGREQPIGPGTWPALSPDGSQLAYSGADGISIVNLATGEAKSLPGTNENDYNPLWSPDGTRIAFVRGAGAFDIYLVAADGTELQQLTHGPAYESAGGWLPDGQHFIFGEPNADGLLLRQVNITDGSIHDLFTIQGTKDLSLAVSPDGSRLAYMEGVFGYKRGLFISNLDGTERQFFGDADREVFSDPIWSPDGRWLLISVWDEQVNAVLPFLALVQVDPCQIIPLPDLTGQFSSWVP